MSLSSCWASVSCWLESRCEAVSPLAKLLNELCVPSHWASRSGRLLPSRYCNCAARCTHELAYAARSAARLSWPAGITQLSSGAPALRHSVAPASASLSAPTHGEAYGLLCAQASSNGLGVAAGATAGTVSAAARAQARTAIVRDTPLETPGRAVTCAPA